MQSVPPEVRYSWLPTAGQRDRLDSPPAQIIGLEPGLIPAAVVLDVSQGQDSREAPIHKHIGGIFLAAGARGAVAAIETGTGRVAGDIPCSAITGSVAASATPLVPAKWTGPTDIQTNAMRVASENKDPRRLKCKLSIDLSLWL